MITIEVNGTSKQIDIEPDTPLLWTLRDVVGLTGTKFGCGIAQCGACTVHVNGSPMRSCSVPIGVLDGAKITTIEGLSPDLGRRGRGGNGADCRCGGKRDLCRYRQAPSVAASQRSRSERVGNLVRSSRRSNHHPKNALAATTIPPKRPGTA
jgi:2Fe-2S iron-sulfur cluster binding domain